MRFAAAAFVALVLSGCAGQGDDYGDPLLTECRQPDQPLAITYVVYPSLQALRTYFLFRDADIPVGVEGQYLVEDTGPEIHVPPLRGQQDTHRLTIWGHELAHALCGRWHS